MSYTFQGGSTKTVKAAPFQTPSVRTPDWLRQGVRPSVQIKNLERAIAANVNRIIVETDENVLTELKDTTATMLDKLHALDSTHRHLKMYATYRKV